MGDMGELFNELKAASREKRSKNKEWSTNFLREQGIEFKSFNNGVHLRIEPSIDFWPSTGRWIAGQYSRRGVKELVKFIKANRRTL